MTRGGCGKPEDLVTVTSSGLRLGPLGVAAAPLGGGVLRLALLALNAGTAAAHVGQTADDKDDRHDAEDQHVEHDSLEHNAFSSRTDDSARSRGFVRAA